MSASRPRLTVEKENSIIPKRKLKDRDVNVLT